MLQRLRDHFGSAIVIVNNDWPLITKFWQTDLSSITTTLQDLYSDQGAIPRDPASILRSYLIYLMTHPEKGLTKWVDIMKRTPIYAILSGFEPHDLPGVGIFYDFFRRLWPIVDNNLKSKKQKKRKRKPKKGKKEEKTPTATPGRVKRLVEWISDPLFQFFQTHIASVSAELGLLGNLTALSLAGDGTPIVTTAFTRSKSTCDCHAQGLADCKHSRIYSQPDCDSGWDSSREKYFNGYHLYMISAADSKHDLPLYPRLQPASRHDAVSLVISMTEFNQRFNLGIVDKMLLDAAHDAEAIYTLIDHQSIEPFIDLSNRGKKNMATRSDVQISPTGVPICPNSKLMKPNGFDRRSEDVCHPVVVPPPNTAVPTTLTMKNNLRLFACFQKPLEALRSGSSPTNAAHPLNAPTSGRRSITS